MASVSADERERIDGLAAFASASLGLAMIVIAALERVGAPDSFVVALGPLFAFAGLVVIGLASRSPNLPEFLAARRAVPPGYGGLALAVVGAGLALGLSSRGGGLTSWAPVVPGFLIAALIVAPALRRTNVSGVADLLATHFPVRGLSIAYASALFATAALAATAGFELSVESISASLGMSRRAAEILVFVILALSAAPGGVKGVIWSDAASGGLVLLVACVGFALAFWRSPEPLGPLQQEAAALLATPGYVGAWTQFAALALAIATTPLLTAPAIASPSGRAARGAGLTATLLGAAGVCAAIVALPHAAARAAPSAEALIAMASWMPALALARAGAYAASRADGIELASAYSRLSVLASRRIALGRLSMLGTLAVAAIACDRLSPPPAKTLEIALAIQLAFVAPSLILALTRRAPRAAGAAALGAAAAAAVALAWLTPGSPWPDLMPDALGSAAAGLAAGAVLTAMRPERRRRPSLSADPFVDVPLDAFG